MFKSIYEKLRSKNIKHKKSNKKREEKTCQNPLSGYRGHRIRLLFPYRLQQHYSVLGLDFRPVRLTGRAGVRPASAQPFGAGRREWSLPACRLHATSQSLVPIIQQQQSGASRYYFSSQPSHSASRTQPTERRQISQFPMGFNNFLSQF